MTRFLIDEMFPPTTSSLLRDVWGRDALHVVEIGLQATADSLVAAAARSENRAFVTENVVDFASERDIVLIFVLKRNLAPGRAQAHSLATLLHQWATDNPTPYVGQHWPTSGS